MGVTTTKINKPFNPRAQDASPLAYNRAALYSGKALSFDGVNDYVQCDNLDTLYSSDFTISYFFKWESTGDNWGTTQGSAGTNLALLTGKDGSGVIRFAFWGNDLDAPASLTPAQNEWSFLSFTYNRTTKARKIYINGILAAEDVSAANPNPTANTFQIGAFTAIGGYYNNQVSNVKVFNTALTAAQIADLYNFPEKIVPTGVDNTALKLWLPMMESAGTTAYDGSGNGNHGTIAGATYVNGVGAAVAQTSVIDWNKGTNYLEQTEAIATSSLWAKSVTINGGQLDPIGGTNAVEWVSTSTNNHQLFNAQTIAEDCVLSCYVKSDEPCAYLAAHSNGFVVYYDLTTQTISATKGGGVSGEIETFGDWYKITAYFPALNTEIQIGFLDAVYTGTSGSPWNITTANGTSGFIAFPSLIEGTTKGPYIPNHTNTAITTPVLLPQGLTTGRDITGVNLFENVRKQGALNLDGSSWAEVHDNASLDMTDAISAECWVYWRQTTASNDSGLLSRWDGATGRQFLIYHNTTTSVQFYIDNANSQYQSMTEGWHHIVGTYDKVNRKIYVDGVLRDTDAQTISIPSSDDKIEIGRYAHTASKSTEDTIAQPRIYNRALTNEEIQRNYNAGKNIYS